MTVELATEAYDRRRHQVSEFSCGRRALDEWLKRYARQGERRDTARTFVRADRDGRVLGYYVLVATPVERNDATPVVAAGTIGSMTGTGACIR